MFPDLDTSGIAHAIQLALAPVFLLTALGAMLAVMTGRLARIVDRARTLETLTDEQPERAEHRRAELVLIARRARVVSWAIALCTTTALLVAAVVAMLFLGAVFQFQAGVTVALLFVAAMIAMIAALSLFLREVFLSTSTLRFNGATLRELSRARHHRHDRD